MKFVKDPLVSIVITTKNEEKNIGNCLESIKKQDYPEKKIEIIVVDNGSVDLTKKIAGECGVRVFNKGPERSAQRNFGIEKANGKYVIYLDADMILSPAVVKKSVELLENSDLIALYIPEVILGNSYWSRVRRFERSFYDGTTIDCVRFFKKEVFDKVGGFDLNMTGPEDWDFDKKIRKVGKTGVVDEYDFKEIDDKLMKIDYQCDDLVGKLSELSIRALVYHNEAEFNLKKYFLKKNYYAKSFSTYINKWGKNDPDIKKQFGFWYRYFGVFLENRKRKRALQFPLLILGIIYLRFFVGVAFIKSKIDQI